MVRFAGCFAGLGWVFGLKTNREDAKGAKEEEEEEEEEKEEEEKEEDKSHEL